MPIRVLVGFAESLAAIEVAASLRNSGYDVVLFSRETSLTALSTGTFSKQLEKIISPDDDVEACVTELKLLWEQLGRPPVFPLDDISLWLASKLAIDYPEIAIIGPRGQLAELALDKGLQLDCAKAAGFSVLETLAGEDPRNSAFPRFVKGRLAAEIRDGRVIRTGGRRVASFDELREFVDTVGDAPTICQPCAEGVGEGIFGIAMNGRLLHVSGHRRVRMMNPLGSGSSACVSRIVESSELECTRRFLEISEWNGLFMLEFLRDQAGTPWFMELNGRPWGSMALARAQGFDYPTWAADLEIKRTEPCLPPNVAGAYTRNVECRHFGREMIHLAHLFRQALRTGKSEPSISASLLGMIAPRRKVDYYNLPSAGWGIFFRDTIFSLARHSISTPLGRLLTLPARMTRRWRSITIEATSSRAALAARRKAIDARRIAVVCYGNINRSAVAAIAMKGLLPGNVTIESCGLHRRCGRPADPTMVEIGRKLGIDLSAHRSRTFSSSTANEADLILVMERWHIAHLQIRYPQTCGKVFLFGLFGNGPAEIPDPFSKSEETYSFVAKYIIETAEQFRNIRV